MSDFINTITMFQTMFRRHHPTRCSQRAKHPKKTFQDLHEDADSKIEDHLSAAETDHSMVLVDEPAESWMGEALYTEFPVVIVDVNDREDDPDKGRCSDNENNHFAETRAADSLFDQ